MKLLITWVRSHPRTVRPLLLALLITVVLPAVASAERGGDRLSLGSEAGAPATRQVTVAPVTATGQLASGYHATAIKSYGSQFNGTCSGQSVFAKSPGIDSCGFGYTDTPMCWASTAESILCSDDLLSHTLTRIAYRGSYTRQVVSSHPIPLELQLANGFSCVAHTDGAWGPVSQHPDWAGDYYCFKGKVDEGFIYGPSNSDGIDIARSTWTVNYFATNRARARTVAVSDAYYGGIAG